MNFWQALNQIIKQSSFAKRKLGFFVIVLVFGISIYYLASNRTFMAATVSPNYSYSSRVALDYNLELKNDGSLIVNGDSAGYKYLSSTSSQDTLSFIAVDSPGFLVSESNVYLKLPSGFDQSKIETDIIGLGVGSKQVSQMDSRTFYYNAESIAPTATFTIVAHFPKGMIKFSLYKRVLNFFAYQAVDWWLWSSAILAISTILVLFLLLRRRLSINRLPEPKVEITSLPSDLSPAVVNVLKTAKLSGRDIAAILIDLANRGYITIYSKGQDFTFGKTNRLESSNPAGLEKYEVMLLDKIFTESFKSTKADVQIRIGRHIFSRKIATIYYLIYEIATLHGFFEENPYRTHARYKIVGIVLFFIAAACFVASLIFNHSWDYNLFLWFALMLSAALIVKASSKIMPVRTRKGNEALKEWLAFENFLKNPQRIAYQSDLSSLYIKNLPYAIALGKEVEWTERFLDQPFAPPDWFDGVIPARTLDELANELFPLVGYVGGSLHQIHEPTVD